MSTPRENMSTPESALYMSRYHEYTGGLPMMRMCGYHEYTRGCSVHQRDTMSTSKASYDEWGNVHYTGVSIQIQWWRLYQRIHVSPSVLNILRSISYPRVYCTDIMHGSYIPVQKFFGLALVVPDIIGRVHREFQ